MRHSVAIAFIACLLLAGLPLTRSPAASPDVHITVRASAVDGALAMRLGTQFAWPGSLDRALNSRDRFEALASRLVRINATTDGFPGLPLVMPAGLTQGDWDFGNLDAIVSDIHRAGGDVVLDIAYAPQWMWDCTTGTIRDPTFNEFASYMARVVAYYNTGSLVTEDGRVITNPAGTANRIGYWELWNEPDLRTLGCPNGNPNIGPDQYVTMWNASALAMLAVDRSLRLVGPSTSAAVTSYLPALMRGAVHRPDAVSFHAYGGWDNSQTDRFFFDGDSVCCGLRGIENGIAQMNAVAPGIPVWITELNVNAAWNEDDPTARPWTAFGAAWGACAFLRLARRGIDAAFEFQFANPSRRQLSLIDIETGQPLLSYWRDYYLARYFPPGSTLVAATSTNGEVETLAARAPDSSNVRVLVINRQIENDTIVGGSGLPANVRVTMQSLPGVSMVTLRQIDAGTTLGTGPELRNLQNANSVSISFTGYGLALLEFVTDPSRAV